MSMTPEAARIRQNRMTLLKMLNMVYPGTLRGDSLLRNAIAMDPTYDRTLFARDIDYLRERHLVMFVEEGIGLVGEPVGKRYIKLTPEGKDRADGITIDQTLEI